ncbi:MAG: hypothetical protein LBC53_02425 [Spirochaetaceae bacterium]|jgi:hypothetical protein|nr:hypothetical protein [Spirochaetaceae bacterium]
MRICSLFNNQKYHSPLYFQTLAVFFSSIFLSFIIFNIVKSVKHPQDSAGGGWYVAVVLEQGADVKAALKALEERRIKKVEAEENQKVFLNDFSRLLEITPSEFLERVIEKDPRNDGFARRMHDFFTSGGETRLFIPKSGLPFSGGAETIEDKLKDALSGFPVLAVYFPFSYAANQEGADVLKASFFLAAWLLVVFLFVKQAYKKSVRGVKNFLRVFPLALILPCAFINYGGFALAALLLSFRALFSGHILNAVISLRRGAALKKSKEVIIQSVVFAFVFILTSVFFKNFIFALELLFLFFAGEVISILFYASSPGKPRRARFFAMPLKAKYELKYKAPFSVLIFLVFAVAAQCFSYTGLFPRAIVKNSGSVAEAQAGPFEKAPLSMEGLDEEAYQKHYLFQKNFSYRRIFNDAAQEAEDPLYANYSLGEDGLINGISSAVAPEGLPAGGLPYSFLELFNWTQKKEKLPPALLTPSSGASVSVLHSMLSGFLVLFPFIFFTAQRKLKTLFLYKKQIKNSLRKPRSAAVWP